ncbi:archease [Candidatus Uhrbacteria bacterium]|nr:archease [Candidatus Uhrbacteria bacterium]
MHSYDLLPHIADVRVRARGSTRAGLLTAALKGMFVAAQPRAAGNGNGRERSFHLTAEDASTLLADVLNEALSFSRTNQETYDDVRFDLITDKEAKGAFVGKAVSGFKTPIQAAKHHGLSVQKNAEGLWEATITFDAS